MALLNKMKDSAKDPMADPSTKAKIEKIAHDKGITLEKAKEHFMKKDHS